MDQSPDCAKGNTAVYSPLLAVGLAPALMINPFAEVARIVGRNPLSRVFPCCRTVKVRARGFPATAYSGKPLSVIIAQPPANALLARINNASSTIVKDTR